MHNRTVVFIAHDLAKLGESLALGEGKFNTVGNELDDLLVFVQSDRRVCPLPPLWNEMWKVLSARNGVGQGVQPSAPLILGAWWYTSDADKRERFLYHIRWAADHGALPYVSAFIVSLSSDQWHYEGQ